MSVPVIDFLVVIVAITVSLSPFLFFCRAAKYGDTADECGEAFFLCGKSLLELARFVLVFSKDHDLFFPVSDSFSSHFKNLNSKLYQNNDFLLMKICQLNKPSDLKLLSSTGLSVWMAMRSARLVDGDVYKWQNWAINEALTLIYMPAVICLIVACSKL